MLVFSSKDTRSTLSNFLESDQIANLEIAMNLKMGLLYEISMPAAPLLQLCKPHWDLMAETRLL